MEIKLSEIQIVPTKPKDGLLAFTSFILNNSFYVGDVAIYSRLGQDGYRLVYPLKVLSNGFKVNCFHPIRREVAQAIEDQVIKAFLELTEKAMTKAGRGNDGYSGEG
jgi:DNA-binding cell septation regulator SpoVG